MNDYQYAMRFLRASHALKDLRAVLPEFLVFKGVAWALYQNQLERIGPGDLDVWIPQDFKTWAYRLAQHAQFVCEIPVPVPHLEKIKALQFLHRPSGLIIDLHQGLFQHYLPKKQGLTLDREAWSTRVTLQKDSIQLQTLSKPLAALYVVLHAEKHHWAFKKDLRDIAFFLPHLSSRFTAYTKKPLQAYGYVTGEVSEIKSGAQPFLDVVKAKGNHPSIHRINYRMLRYYLASSPTLRQALLRFWKKVNLHLVYDFYQFRHWPWVLKSFLPILLHLGLLQRRPNSKWLQAVKQNAVEA